MVVWGNWAEGRAASDRVEIFQVAVLASNDVNALSEWFSVVQAGCRQGEVDVLWCNPAKDSSRPFCALGFPFSA